MTFTINTAPFLLHLYGPWFKSRRKKKHHRNTLKHTAFQHISALDWEPGELFCVHEYEYECMYMCNVHTKALMLIKLLLWILLICNAVVVEWISSNKDIGLLYDDPTIDRFHWSFCFFRQKLFQELSLM